MRSSHLRGDLAESALIASIAVFHVVDHELVHERWHVLSHATAGAVASGAAFALGASPSELGLSFADLGRGVRVGGAISAGILGAFAVVAALPAADPLLADPRVDDLPRHELARRALLDIPVGTAVYEELVFRSALLGLALRRHRPPVAIGLTSAVFGLWHLLPAIEDRRRDERVAARPVVATVGPAIVGTAVAGVGFGVLRLWAGSVVAPMLVHAATNVGALLASGVSRRRRRTNPIGPTPATQEGP